MATVVGEGSTWNNLGNLHVGYKGNGTLRIEAGGVVSVTGGYVGDESDSIGEVIVTGEGSEWNNSSDFYVGRYGNGTLNIADGGMVKCRRRDLGSKRG